MKIIECVPNFSEGRDLSVIDRIKAEIVGTERVKLLHSDIGYDANRTVLTFAGDPEAVVEAAFKAFAKSAELIDMSKHHGAHPRIGAVDVCPLIPVSEVSMDEAVILSKKLSERVDRELGISVYNYEKSASCDERRKLESCRSGEYEGLPLKLTDERWKPDYGPDKFNVRSGASVIGARKFLIAYNVNLDTQSVEAAKIVAAKIRESGYIKRKGGDVLHGEPVLDANGGKIRVEGLLKTIKAIGWMMPEYGCAQVSTNITDFEEVSVYTVFETIKQEAEKIGVNVAGSELIGLIPKKALVDAGLLYAKKRGIKVFDNNTLIEEAVRNLGLDSLAPFDVKTRILDNLLVDL